MSDYKEWLGKDVQPEQAPQKLTGAAYWKNWWHYHWAIVVAVVAVVAILLRLLLGALGVGQVEPDYQIAYVGSTELPTQTVEALTDAIAALGKDENGDGEVVVKVNQYITPDTEQNEDAAMEQYASTIQLTADLADGDSYFWLVESPDTFQQRYQALANLDGSSPADGDLTAMDKVYRWADCPVLASLDLGDYEENLLGQIVTGANQDLLADLYFGRRCFYSEEEEAAKSSEGFAALWDTLTEGAVQ